VERNDKIEEKPFFPPMSLFSNTKATQQASQASRNHVACSLGAIHSVQTMTKGNEMKLLIELNSHKT
jgi:hypothetical protein